MQSFSKEFVLTPLSRQNRQLQGVGPPTAHLPPLAVGSPGEHLEDGRQRMLTSIKLQQTFAKIFSSIKRNADHFHWIG